jgi:serine/threonine-protein kinase
MSVPRVGRSLGRYALFDEIASGGMASVHIARLIEPLGFSRTVAIKRLHAQFAKDEQFVAMFLDEARLAARVRHPNVIPTLDVLATEGELFLVMEYVLGETLARLITATRAKGEHVPPRVATAILIGVLNGLHAAHEAKSDRGAPLGIVHRDVSPHNILVGVDGVPRLIDFGVAKAAGRIHTTQDGMLKGKLAYMSPEQLQDKGLDRRTDTYAAAVVLWETLTGARLFVGESQGATITKVLGMPVDPPSLVRPELGEAFDAVIMRGLDRNPDKRFQTAREMARALEAAVPAAASPNEIGEWLESIASSDIAQRGDLVAEIEGTSSSQHPPIESIAAASKQAVKDAPPRAITGEVSSVSVSRDQRVRPNRRILFGGIATAVGVAGIIALFLAWPRTSPRASDPPPAPSPIATGDPPATVSIAASAPSPPPAPSASMAATQKPTPTVRTKIRPAPTTASSASDCDRSLFLEPGDPGYVPGIKSYKPWCFKK